jgi:hypothetical protein
VPYLELYLYGDVNLMGSELTLLVSLVFISFGLGYGLGRRMGRREGIEEGLLRAPLDIRRQSLLTGKCLICESDDAEDQLKL